MGEFVNPLESAQAEMSPLDPSPRDGLPQVPFRSPARMVMDEGVWLWSSLALRMSSWSHLSGSSWVDQERCRYDCILACRELG